jgi:heme oxygenase
MERLRGETASEHVRLERVTGMMSPHLTVDGYRRYLLEMGAVHAALEPRLSGLEGLAAALPDVEQRRKLPLLERDLAALGVSPSALADLARSRPPPPCSGVAEALGVLYVLEGSTLGGRLIRRHLEAVLGSSVAGATSYLDAYGEVGGPWRRFGAAAEAYGTAHPGAPAAMAAAAVATFRALLAGWGEASGPA